MTETTVPQVNIYPWPKLVMAKQELKDIFTYLAYKTKRPVVLRKFTKDEGYSEHFICVCIVLANSVKSADSTNTIKLYGKNYELAEEQKTVDIDLTVPEEKKIADDDYSILALVDHNRIVVPVELTAKDNETARVLLAHIAEKAIDPLDFNMNAKLLQQRKKLAQSFCNSFAVAVRRKVREIEDHLKESERKAQQAYFTIINFERQRPVLQKELKFLKRLQKIRRPRLYRRQAHGLIELIASGQFLSIEPKEAGSIQAVTSAITIQHNHWKFPVGRYSINLEADGHINMEALDEHPDAEYPHPHISTDGSPCLGNISGDISKMLASMRIAEVLQTLHEFLASYNSENPYETISHFDSTGQYYDEDDDPCEDCDECCSPYCIFECTHNRGQYSCEDCYEYRTDYCYLECVHNRDFECFSPCDSCEDRGTEYCYLDCQYNDRWQLQSPCESCELDECSCECPYFNKLQDLKEVNTNANPG